MSKLLELPHLVNEYGVPDVQVWCGRVEAGFDDERPALLQLRFKSVFGQNLFAAANKFLQLFLDICHDVGSGLLESETVAFSGFDESPHMVFHSNMI